MRFWLVAAMVGAAGVVVLAMLFLYFFPLRNFLKRSPELRNEADLVMFKRLASSQMYVSLVAHYMIWLPLLIWLVGKFVLGELTWWDGLAFVIIPLLVQFALSAGAIGTARAVRSTPTANDTLAAERDRVVDVWVRKKYPEW